MRKETRFKKDRSITRFFREKYISGLDIQTIIMATLTTLTICTTVAMGLLLYNRFMVTQKEITVSNAENMVLSAVDRIDEEVRAAKEITSAANYNVIREYDIANNEFSNRFSLLYETNTDKIQSMALYDSNGRLIISEPVGAQKEGADARTQEWFTGAMADIENMHFTTPHIQDILVDETYRYNWVISVSTSVDINDGTHPSSGVLLVDLKYSVISEIMDRMNEDAGDTYYYLCTSDGTLLYHPRKVEITRGLYDDDYEVPAAMEDGTYQVEMAGKDKEVVVSSVSYTGWRLVAVVPATGNATGVTDFRYYLITTALILLMLLLIVNRMITRKISGPILKLNESVKAYETGGKPDIYIGGSAEIRHLGYSVKKSYEQIQALMDEIILQQNERRKSELAALQSQINPHFLYNTLESITWMVEAGKNSGAVEMISELAKLLRISLSEGKTIIKISEELQHSKSYLNIQKVRYRDRFRIIYDIDDEIGDYCTVKLVLQPLLENAIYYGVGNMDPDDGGLIRVHGYLKDGDVYIAVEDNGYGMSEETVSAILTDNSKVPKHGSGVGVINVHHRIRLLFGDPYGLLVESEADEGTRVTIHLPAVLYSQENQELLETQKYTRENKQLLEPQNDTEENKQLRETQNHTEINQQQLLAKNDTKEAEHEKE